MGEPLHKKPRKAGKTTAFSGWKTTDEDEIARRRLRASVETMKIESVEPDHPIYGTFSVRSLKSKLENQAYFVEIRALAEFRNACTCPDYRVNGLGTCKHIEAVLARIRRGHRRLANSARNDAASPRIEIYLVRQGAPEIRAALPGIVPLSARQIVTDFFSTAGVLLGDPATAVPALRRVIAAAPPRCRAAFRIGRDVEDWFPYCAAARRS